MSANATDEVISDYERELEDRSTFIDNIVQGAKGRDLNPSEMELVTKETDRMTIITGLLEPLRQTARITTESRAKMREVAKEAA
ncbi:MAG: hypothetical protein EHM24_25380, partial [Acidobacteria bacterium]